MNFWHAAYRRLALAFPHEFKLAYGDEMLQTGEDAIDYLARRHGFAGLLRILLDLLLRLPAEYLSEVRFDLRYAIRTLLKSPGYAFVGILSIGLGIGLTTNLYTAAWTLLTRTLSGVTDPNRLVTGKPPRRFPGSSATATKRISSPGSPLSRTMCSSTLRSLGRPQSPSALTASSSRRITSPSSA
jgi:hypothetical protein